MKSLACVVAALCSCTDSPSTEYAAVVRGTLFTSDLAQARAMHDQIAQAGQATAMARGDFAHDVLLGTSLLDSTPNQFLAIDRWTDREAMEAFYANPAGIGALFASPPSIEFFVAQDDWVQWGTMQSGHVFDPSFIHFALGDLAQPDESVNRAAHDQVASGGKEPSLGAGNVAHVVVLGMTDPRRFLAFDIWRSSDNIEAFYTNPAFVQAFAPLFSSVTEPVFRSTDWYQW